MSYRIGQGDLTPDMELQITVDDVGTGIVDEDVVEMVWLRPDGTTAIVPLIVDDAPTGQLRRVWVRGDTDVPGTHLAQVRVTHAPASTGPTALTIDAGAWSISRAIGSFLDDGFGPGMRVVTSGFFEVGNNGLWTVLEVSDLEVVVTDPDGMTDEVALSGAAVTGVDARPQTFPGTVEPLSWRVRASVAR